MKRKIKKVLMNVPENKEELMKLYTNLVSDILIKKHDAETLNSIENMLEQRITEEKQ